jgi:hypothetical protein
MSDAQNVVPSTNQQLSTETITDLVAQTFCQVEDPSTISLFEMEHAEIIPVEVGTEYFTPKNPGEQKRVIFDKILVVEMLVNRNNEMIPVALETAFFFEVRPEHGIVRVANASKRLIGILQDAKVPSKTALLLTYQGKEKNKNNAYFSDRWSVMPLNVRKLTVINDPAPEAEVQAEPQP